MLAALAATAIGAAAPAMAQKTVTVVREIDTDRYDPHKSTARSGAEVMYMIGDTLVNLDFDMKTLKPGLATSWTVSPDGLTYTFKLRDDVTFCSGKKMTAKDVVATYERWLDPETKGLVKWRMGDVDKVTAVDDTTVEYKLKKPFSELLYQMTQYFHTILNVEQAKQLGADFGIKGIDGTGPFCFESWTPRDSTVLTKHKGYKWGPSYYDVTEAQVDKVIWKVVPEENTRVTALQAGQADASQYVPYWSIKELQANKSLSVSKAENFFWTYFIGFKVDKELMNDVRVRKAMNLAVDQKAITEAVTFGLAEPASTMLMPGVLDFNDKVDRAIYGENVKEAEKLLDEAGWKKGIGRLPLQGRQEARADRLRHLRRLQGDRRGGPGRPAQGRHRPADPALRFDGGVGQARDPGVRRLRHELPLCQRRRCAEPLLPLGQHADAQPHELEGQGDRRAPRQGLDGDRRQGARRGLCRGPEEGA